MIKNRFDQHKKTIVLVILALILLAISIVIVLTKPVEQNASTDQVSNESLLLEKTMVSPQGVHIRVRVADTDETRELGLSHFKSLDNDEGMLFIFPQMGIYPFWMKDMNFPLDIIWIDKNFKIIDRVINVDPSKFPETYTPQHDAQYVLEISANMADTYGFSIGSIVQLQNNE